MMTLVVGEKTATGESRCEASPRNRPEDGVFRIRDAGARIPRLRGLTMMARSFGLGLLLLVSLRAFAAEPDQPPGTLDELKQRIETIVADTRTPAIGIALVSREGP